MNACAKYCLDIPLRVLQRALQAVRDRLVYLTVAFVLGSSWVIAWTKSVELADRRLQFPAAGQGEVAQGVRDSQSHHLNRRQSALVDSSD